MKTHTASRSAPNSPKPADEGTDAALKLFVVLSRAWASVASAAEVALDGEEITPTEFGILEALFHKGPLLHGEIQRKILVTSGGITYLVDRLVEKGLVRREECPNDRRARFAVLTAEGTKLMERIFPAHAQQIAHVMSALSSREQAEATRLLKKLGLTAAALAE
jgi:MarR family 2-MHQ and catechol resistance regulon transcriptional repressor